MMPQANAMKRIYPYFDICFPETKMREHIYGTNATFLLEVRI